NGRCELPLNVGILRKLMIPVSPELNSERGHGLRVGRLAVLEMKGSKRFIDARHARGVAQVIDWVWIRRHDFVEEFPGKRRPRAGAGPCWRGDLPTHAEQPRTRRGGQFCPRDSPWCRAANSRRRRSAVWLH